MMWNSLNELVTWLTDTVSQGYEFSRVRVLKNSTSPPPLLLFSKPSQFGILTYQWPTLFIPFKTPSIPELHMSPIIIKIVYITDSFLKSDSTIGILVYISHKTMASVLYFQCFVFLRQTFHCENYYSNLYYHRS